MALLTPICLVALLAAAPGPASGPPVTAPGDVRAVLLIEGDAAFRRAAGSLIEVPVGRDIELVPRPLYDRAAKREHVRHAHEVTGANRLARSLHLTHAVAVTASPEKHGERRLFVEVVVARLRPRLTVLMAQRFFAPEGKLTTTMAAVVVGRIKDLLLPGEPELGVPVGAGRAAP